MLSYELSLGAEFQVARTLPELLLILKDQLPWQHRRVFVSFTYQRRVIFHSSKVGQAGLAKSNRLDRRSINRDFLGSSKCAHFED